MYFRSCGAGKENGEEVQPHRSFSIFGDGVIESLASAQGPSKVATQIKSVRESKKF